MTGLDGGAFLDGLGADMLLDGFGGGVFLDGLGADMLLVGLDTDAVPDPPLADDIPLEAEPSEPDLWPVNPLPVPPAFPPPLPILFPSWLFCIYLISIYIIKIKHKVYFIIPEIQFSGNRYYFLDTVPQIVYDRIRTK